MSEYAIVQSSRSHNWSVKRHEDMWEGILGISRYNTGTAFATYGVDGAGHARDCCLSIMMKRAIPRRIDVEMGKGCFSQSCSNVESKR